MTAGFFSLRSTGVIYLTQFCDITLHYQLDALLQRKKCKYKPFFFSVLDLVHFSFIYFFKIMDKICFIAYISACCKIVRLYLIFFSNSALYLFFSLFISYYGFQCIMLASNKLFFVYLAACNTKQCILSNMQYSCHLIIKYYVLLCL